MSQKETEKRMASSIRKGKYKKILVKGGQFAEEIGSRSVVENLKIIQRLSRETDAVHAEGTIQDRIGQSSEVLLDSQAVKMATDLLVSTLKDVADAGFSDDMYANAINNFIRTEDGDMDWNKLDELICKNAKTVHYCQSMFAQISIGQDQDETQSMAQQNRQSHKKGELGIEKRPTNLAQNSQPEKGARKLNSVLQQIIKIYNQRGQKPLPYFEVIIDPANMMYTFDNALTISFLFRDLNIGFTTGDDTRPAIYPILAENRPEPSENKQFLVTLDYDLLESMKTRYNITESMLKVNRNDSNDQLE